MLFPELFLNHKSKLRASVFVERSTANDIDQHVGDIVDSEWARVTQVTGEEAARRCAIGLTANDRLCSYDRQAVEAESANALGEEIDASALRTLKLRMFHLGLPIVRQPPRLRLHKLQSIKLTSPTLYPAEPLQKCQPFLPNDEFRYPVSLSE